MEVIVPLEVEVEGGGEGDLLLLDSLNRLVVVGIIQKMFRNWLLKSLESLLD